MDVVRPSALTTEVHRTRCGFRPAAGAVAGSGLALRRTGVQFDQRQTRVSLDGPLLTAEDVAALLAVPRSSVYEYARRLHDPLPSLRIGRHCRFDRASVERWLATQRAG
jgi:excisionase family DNA binding protein